MGSISPTAGTKQLLSLSASPRGITSQASSGRTPPPSIKNSLFWEKTPRYLKCVRRVEREREKMLFTHPFLLQPLVALSKSFFLRSLTCMIMPLLLSAARIFMAIIHQQDSCRENSVCSPALNELTFHEARVFIDELLRVSGSFFRQRWRRAEFTQLGTQTRGPGSKLFN